MKISNEVDDDSHDRPSVSSSSLVLPSGQIIDAKNTLQSFDSARLNAIPVRRSQTDAESGEINREPAVHGLSKQQLPSGQQIDFKNTLQSFHSTNNAQVIPRSARNLESFVSADALVALHPPVLPSGDVINAKNTNQSFRVSRNEVMSPRHPTEMGSELNRLENQTSQISAPYNVEAFAVQSLPYVVAEVLNDENQAQHDHPRTRLSTFWIIAVIVASVAVSSISVYCGLGNCSSGNGASLNPTIGSPLGDSKPSAVPAPSAITVPNSPSVTFPIFLVAAPTQRQPTTAFPISMNPVPRTPFPTISLLPSATPKNASQNGTDTPMSSLAFIFLNNITLIGRSLIVNGTAPEDAALTWMIENDSLFLNISRHVELDSEATNEFSFRFQQRYALLTLWFQQLDSDGVFVASWTNRSGWLMDDDECRWFGISCKSMNFGGNIGTQNVVIEMNINNADTYKGNNVSGTLSSDLGLLSMLEVADFRYNSLTGTIPDALRLWTKIVHFDAAYNRLTGLIPEVIGQWTALSYLDVSYNMLLGPLPIAKNQWINMVSFIVTGNDLSGSLPEWIGQWTSLLYFGIEACSLTGTLPESIGQWTGINGFGASYNALVGSLPSSIGQWTEISYVDISYNQVNSTFPASMQNWTNLEFLSFENNALTGSILESFGKWTALTDIDISANALTGVLPDSIGRWTLLDFMNVSDNAFTGTIPSSIGNWSLIQHAYFNDNQFTGTFPIDICDVQQAHLNVELVTDCLPEISCACCRNVCT